MTDAGGSEPEHQATPGRKSSPPDLKDCPVREYVAAMAVELAQMARWDGDEKLACMLEAAAATAQEAR